MFGRLLMGVRAVDPGWEDFVRHFVLKGGVPLEWRGAVPDAAMRVAVAAVAGADAGALARRLKALEWREDGL
jgi:hypothetical protein